MKLSHLFSLPISHCCVCIIILLQFTFKFQIIFWLCSWLCCSHLYMYNLTQTNSIRKKSIILVWSAVVHVLSKTVSWIWLLVLIYDEILTLPVLKFQDKSALRTWAQPHVLLGIVFSVISFVDHIFELMCLFGIFWLFQIVSFSLTLCKYCLSFLTFQLKLFKWTFWVPQICLTT